MKKKLKRIAALLLAAVFVTTAALPAAAVTTVAPEWTVSAYPGDWITYPVCVNEAENLAAIELVIGYDSDVFSFQGYDFYGMDSATLNSDTPGEISYNGISLDGINGSASLVYLYFIVSSEAEAGSYPITIAVGDACNTSLQSIEVTANGGSITVNGNNGGSTAPSVQFYMWSNVERAEYGQDVSFDVYCYDSQSLAAGNFSFAYDSNLFTFKSVELHSCMNPSNSLYSVNSSNDGYVLVSYAGLDAVSEGHLLTLTLTAKETAEETYTNVQLTTSELYTNAKDALNGRGYTAGVYVSAYVPAPVCPTFTLTAPECALTNETITVIASVDGDSGIAAGDFCICYDTAALNCTDVKTYAEATGETSPNSSMVMTNPDFTSGEVRFSLLCMDGISEDETLVYVTFQPVNVAGTTTLSCSGDSVVDAQFNSVTLDYGTVSIDLEVPTFTVKFYNWDNTLLSTHSVPYLSSAQELVNPTRAFTETKHYRFVGWNQDISCVTENVSVTAQYSEEAHSFGSWTQTVAPSCTGKGTERRDCSGCDHYETREVAAKGHSYTDSVTAPTCTAQGYTTHTCSCGHSYVDTYTDPTEHSYGIWTQTVAPSCTGKGTERRDCSGCDHYETREVAAKGHSYTDSVTAPTCTAQGYTTHTCSCGHSYVDTYTDPTEHSYGAWTQTVAPSCTGKGTERRDCSGCDHYETREVAAKGHSYTDSVTAPTCTAQGYTTHTCSCGHSYVDTYTDPTEHSYGIWTQTVAPSCTGKGTERRDCTGCDHYETREVAAKGHSYTDSVTAPTCTAQGYTTHTCSCGHSYVDTYTDPIGHSFTYAEQEGLLVGVCSHDCGVTDVRIGTPSWRIENDAFLGAEYSNGQVMIALYNASGRLITVKFCPCTVWNEEGESIVYQFSAPDLAAEELAETAKILIFSFAESYVPLRKVIELSVN